MYRIGFILVMVFLFACGNNNIEDNGEETGFIYKTFLQKFKPVGVPYFLADTTIKKTGDTTTLRNAISLSYIPDSVKQNIFGKSTNIKYSPLAYITSKNKESYFVVKAFTPQKAAALLFVFEDEQFGAVFPFLIPDKDDATIQTSSIDKSFSISRNVIRKQVNDVTIEGKDVYAYNKDVKQFTLIMTDLLDEKNLEVINPIDTFAKTHKLTGDFATDKRNIVSIRDGKNDKSLTVFVHIEKNNGECIGEVKGDAVITSSTTAVYRQGGDPCVLEFSFANNSVTLKEVEGCGSRRDLRCLFDGTFKRKEAKQNTESASSTNTSKK